ncbi:MAG: chloride channel protein [Hyphomicrobiaceae bacterium]
MIESNNKPGRDAHSASARIAASSSLLRAIRILAVKLIVKATDSVRPILDLLNAQIGHNLRTFAGDRQFLVWSLGLALGVTVAYLTVAFRWSIGLLQYAWLGTTSEKVASAAASAPWWVVLFAPAVGGAIVGYILYRYMPGRRAQGVADVIEARAVRDSHIPLGAGVWSAVLATLSLGFGASAGREGPMVHLGASVASFVENYFHLSPGSRRTLLACGVAAAVAASFNAPMAGVLFAHEVILAHYALSAFVPIVIASVAATLVARVHLGDFPAFIIPDYQITTYWEFPAFALLGVTCAAVAIAFEAALMVTEKISWKFEAPLWLRPIVGGLMVGSIALVFPQVLGVGYEATDAALKVEYPLWIMLALLVAKTAATAITLATRFAGGIFSPAIYLGAMAGGSFGLIASSVFPDMASSHGLYAILGMGAVAAAVLGAPISSTLIILEVTKGYDISLALMLTVSIAHGLTRAALGHSFFHWQLSRRGLSVQEGPHQEIMRSLTVREFATFYEPDKCRRRDPAAEPDWLTTNDTVAHALRTFDRTGRQRLPIVSLSDDNSIVGSADRMEALDAFNKALIDRHVEEHR